MRGQGAVSEGGGGCEWGRVGGQYLAVSEGIIRKNRTCKGGKEVSTVNVRVKLM